MEMTLYFERSNEWVKAERLRTGENVNQEKGVKVDVCTLSEASRAILLRDGHGSYDNVNRYLRGGDPHDYALARFLFDGDSPASTDVDRMIQEADVRLQAEISENSRKRAEREARQAEEETAREARIASMRAAEKERKAARQAARELLADEMEDLAKANENLDTLAKFIAELPDDAKRGVIRKMAARDEGEAEKAIQKRIEDASPRTRLFVNLEEVGDEDTDEDEDE